jgi:hypothetical protein
MSQFDISVASLLGRYSLIKQIENIAVQQNINYLWQNDKDLGLFIEQLKFHVSISEKDWREDDTFLELINDVNNQIIAQLNDGEKDMATGTELATTGTGLAIGTKFIIAAGVLSLIAIALYAYRCSKNKTETSSNEKDEKSTFKKIGEKAREVKSEIKAGFENPNNEKLQQQATSSSHPSTKQPPIYGQYDLLLIIPANQLDDKLTQGSVISKNDTEKLIANAMRAYCFAQSDPEGQKVLNSVDYSEEPINFKIESRVFLQLSLLAKSGIKKHDKLSIRESIQSDQQVKIKILKKMGSLHSIRDFYGI